MYVHRLSDARLTRVIDLRRLNRRSLLTGSTRRGKRLSLTACRTSSEVNHRSPTNRRSHTRSQIFVFREGAVCTSQRSRQPVNHTGSTPRFRELQQSLDLSTINWNRSPFQAGLQQRGVDGPQRVLLSGLPMPCLCEHTIHPKRG